MFLSNLCIINSLLSAAESCINQGALYQVNTILSVIRPVIQYEKNFYANFICLAM